jgi:hypothetical protein
MPEINAKQAVAAAIGFFKTLYEGVNYFDLLVEEIELDGSVWRITLGYSRPANPAGVFLGVSRPNREYKAFVVNVLTGEVESMKMRGETAV